MASTLNEMFQESVRKYAENAALMGKAGRAYTATSYREMAGKVRQFATGLLALGMSKGDRVALISENRPEWAIADFAIGHGGGVNVGIFPTLPAGQVEYIIRDCGAKFVIVSTREQLAKALRVKEAIGTLTVVTMRAPDAPLPGVMSFDEVVKQGGENPLSDEAYEQLWRAAQPGDWASIIYTSGTMGDPKGAILSHGNFTSNVEVAREVLAFGPGDVLLSFVPLNHVMGRLVDLYLPISGGSTVAYVENLRRLRQNIQEIKPHYMILVPRVLEMFQEGLTAAVEKESSAKQSLFRWALSAAGAASHPAAGHQRGLVSAKARLADMLVFRGIRKRLGLDRLKLFFSGGAPMARSTAEFFAAMKLPVMEGYGLSETSPLVAVNPSHRMKFGTVGPPVRGVEVRIAGDGEILVRGPNVMQGYYAKPEETREAIDEDGWFHTGDVGEFDEDGYLKITDRKKNLLVLANGKKVAPQHLETRLMESHFIAQVVVVGDQRNTVAALVIPAFGHLQEWAKEHAPDLIPDDTTALVRHPEVRRLIRTEIQRLSDGLADFEKVRQFAVLPRELSVDEGELTPTMKVKRRVVLEKYRDVIEEMYGTSASG